MAVCSCPSHTLSVTFRYPGASRHGAIHIRDHLWHLLVYLSEGAAIRDPQFPQSCPETSGRNSCHNENLP